MIEDNFHTCDSPSGSSTSEPHEETNNAQSLNYIDPAFFHKLNQLNSDNSLLFIQPNTISSPPNVLLTPSFVNPLLPNSNSLNEPQPNLWPNNNNYKTAIPELTKSFINHSVTKQQCATSNTNLPGMQIRVLGVPQTGAKSRVETQIKLCIQLVTDDGDKAQRWSHLKLPGPLVAKEKLKRQILISSNGSKITNISGLENTTLLPEKVLYLSARVICASDPNRKVTTCIGCIQRERKRSQRRKENKNKSEAEENKIEDEKAMAIEEQRVLLFNCSEVVDFNSGDAILPTRITCYCRHHNERLGFCIYFEMNDHTGKQVASGMSPPIMITDDHKSNKQKINRKRPRTELDSTNRISSFDSRQLGNHYQIQPRSSLSTDLSFLPPPASSPEQPLLQRLIPNEGPTYGGIEVTLLGSGFRSGLTCMFGDVAASSTHYWSPNTLVCILPPAVNPGTVVVSFKEHPMVIDSQDVTLFTYYNENDHALMELALQVVGLKMTGKVEDAREIAMRIVQGGDNQDSDSNQKQPQTANLELHIMQVLEVMITFRDIDSHDVSITSAQGHTMLHLAAMLGFTQLIRMLIDLGCHTNATDKNGYTALHYAAWYQHREIVRLLLDRGLADSQIANRWNKRPIEMTEDVSIRHMLWNHVVLAEDDTSSGYSSVDDSLDDDDEYSEDEESSVWLGDVEEESDESWGPCYLSDSEVSLPDELVSVTEGLRHRRKTQQPFIQYLNDVETASYSPEEIVDAEPLHSIDSLTEDEKDVPKEMNWMQRTLSHFQPTASNDLLQNIKNTIPAKPTELNLKTIADHILQFPSKPASMMSGLLFSNNQTNEQEEPPAEQTLAWYMALAYAMGARSLTSEDEKEENQTTTSQEEYTITRDKRRDRRLYSFWVPMLCLMIVWLIFQFISSHPGVVDTIISISGFRRQYLTIH